MEEGRETQRERERWGRDREMSERKEERESGR